MNVKRGSKTDFSCRSALVVKVALLKVGQVSTGFLTIIAYYILTEVNVLQPFQNFPFDIFHLRMC